MKPEQYRKIREPIGALYDAVAGAAGVFARLAFGLRVRRERGIPREGPLLVLCSHQGMTDFAVTAAALLPRRMHFVCSENYFRMGPLARLLHALGVIPKVQFNADPRCIASILRTLRDGGAVCVYPTGQTSMVGTQDAVGGAIARLAKRSGADVWTLRLHGGFFTRSRHARGIIRGRIDAHVAPLFSAGELKSLSEQEAYSAICRAIGFDEYRWQRETGVRFHSFHRARGYQNLLSLCPRCGARYSYRARGNRVWCERCGNAAAVGPDMRLHAQAGSAVPETLPQWRELLIRDWEERLSRGGTLLESRVRCLRYDGRRFVSDGEGELALDEHELRYAPRDGQAIVVRNAALSGMRCATGRYLELETERGTLRLYPDEGRAVAEWKLAQEYLHLRARARE